MTRSVIMPEQKTLIRLYDELIFPLIAGLKACPPEREEGFVRRFTEFYSSKKFVADSLLVDTRSYSIHGKPYAFFSNNKQCELSDIIILVKFYLGNLPIRKVTFIQAKYVHPYREIALEVDNTQLNLYLNWPDFSLAKKRKKTVLPFRLKGLDSTLSSYEIQHFQGLGWGISSKHLDAILQMNGRTIKKKKKLVKRINYQLFTQHVFLPFETLGSFLVSILMGSWGEDVGNSKDLERLVARLYEIYNIVEDPPEDWVSLEKTIPDKGRSTLIEISIKQEKRERRNK